jgi:hypothetical protein
VITALTLVSMLDAVDVLGDKAEKQLHKARESLMALDMETHSPVLRFLYCNDLYALSRGIHGRC